MDDTGSMTSHEPCQGPRGGAGRAPQHGRGASHGRRRRLEKTGAARPGFVVADAAADGRSAPLWPLSPCAGPRRRGRLVRAAAQRSGARPGPH